MTLERDRAEWETLAQVDPLWAVLTHPRKRGGSWDRGEFLATGEAEIRGVLEAAEPLARPARRRRALDFGCGAGRLTRALALRFDTAIGVDISESMVEKASQLNADVAGCEFRVSGAPDLRQFGDGEFDFVYSSLVLQHLPDATMVKQYVAEFLRVAAPDGLVVFGVPAWISFRYRLAVTRRLYGVLRHLGVSDDTILRRTRLTPMRMTAVSESAMRELLELEGARLLRLEPHENGAVRTLRYFVAPDRD